MKKSIVTFLLFVLLRIQDGFIQIFSKEPLIQSVFPAVQGCAVLFQARTRLEPEEKLKFSFLVRRNPEPAPDWIRGRIYQHFSNSVLKSPSKTFSTMQSKKCHYALLRFQTLYVFEKWRSVPRPHRSLLETSFSTNC